MLDVNELIDNSTIWIIDNLGDAQEDKSGVHAVVLLGMYKALRKYVLRQFDNDLNVYVGIQCMEQSIFDNLMGDYK